MKVKKIRDYGNKNSRRLSKNAMMKGEAKNTKGFCQVCGSTARVKNIIFHKGSFKCHTCMMRTPNSRLMQSASTIGRIGKTLEQALNKVYEVHAYPTKKGGLVCMIHVPSVLALKRVKLQVIED